MHREAILVSARARFGSLKARSHFPRFVSKGGSYFALIRIPPEPIFRFTVISDHAFIYNQVKSESRKIT